ncbi:MAG: methyltransferase [Caldilineaceae bacterium SB0661_bin_32]|uniref:Methyltransferase n=1 Tax=Caldilineaceae bacterium SB0661_bin_32 TaxID=2605255 RepID=A0A6B1DB39_9CHLR|nr:methyltransferase [Caldilineaceae bacterium SB0661_bin_32]
MKELARPVSKHLLNIEDKNRSSLFPWRGQFSPQLVECILEAYCPPASVVLDPFVGSGTVLLEAARIGLPAFGFDINPSAWSFSKIYEFANILPRHREHAIAELNRKIVDEFPIVIFSDPELEYGELEERIIRVGTSLSDEAKILCSALVVMLDLHNNTITADFVRAKLRALTNLVHKLPYSSGPIKVHLQDARSLSLENQSVDFVITSPPYINVFNYHQNYRRSVELLGWNILRVARSELGSNRANRGNRFLTVIQYCIDMAATLQELARVLKPGGSAIVIAGHESRVLGVPFYNADIIRRIAVESGSFEFVLRQERQFKNRYGKSIREDILNLALKNTGRNEESFKSLGPRVARDALNDSAKVVERKNQSLLIQALDKAQNIEGTPVFDGSTYEEYQTRDAVIAVREQGCTTTYESK